MEDKPITYIVTLTSDQRIKWKKFKSWEEIQYADHQEANPAIALHCIDTGYSHVEQTTIPESHKHPMLQT